MSLKPWNEQQLRFNLPGLDEVGEDAEERGISPEQARQISAAARQQLEVGRAGKLPEWHGEYLMLIEQGWPWRVATYIAWAISPKIGRKPETLKELAETVLGLKSPRVISNWRKKYPSIDAVISYMQAKAVWEFRPDAFKALVENATRPDYKTFNDRKLFFEMTGDYIPKSQVHLGDLAKDLSELSDAELDQLIGSADSVEKEADSAEGEGEE